MSLLIFCILLAQDSKDIDAIVLKHVDKDGPGVAVLALKDGKVIHKKGYGLADLESKAAITPQTPFELASCSKQFTAIAILLLMERGRLKPADDIRTWLKEMKVHDKDRPIRVQDLVHHTSGLTDYLGHVMEDASPATMGNEGALKLIAERSLNFRTGRRWEYSNSNYCMLSLIIERITKKSFGTFMADNVFKPLKMKTATVLEKGSTPANAAKGYRPDGGEFVHVPSGPLTTGDGGIHLSLDDWVAFEAGLQGLLKKDSLERAYQNGKLDNGDPHQYGYGLLVNKTASRTMVGHEGQWAGFRTYFVRRVEERVTLVLMSNREDMDFRGLSAEIMTRLLE